MKKITFLLLFVMMCGLGFAQTFTSDATSDPATYPADMQNGNGTTAATCGTADELTLPSTAVTGVGTLGTTNILESVTLNVTHTWNSDIVISLQDPSGAVTVLLTDDVAGNGDGFVNLVLQDGAAALPTANTDPLTGTFAPLEALAGFNSGTTAGDGVWNLIVCDDAGGDVGTVDSWALTFAPTPTCSSPAGATATPTSPTSADFSWSDVPTATLGFEWGILAPGGDPDVDTFLFSGSTGAGVVAATEAGLTDATDYVFYVRANCDTAGFSSWSGGTAFTTPALPPANDDACNAIMLNIGDASTGAFYSNEAASVETGEVPGTCYFGTPSASDTVWFSFVAPVTGEVLIQTEELAGDGTLNDTQITLFTVGDCTDLSTAVEVACDEDDDANVVGDGAGLQANLQVAGLTAGATYYFVIDGFGADTGTFDVSLTDPTLSVESFENENTFTYFPNPVRNELTLSAQKDIQNVSIYNMLGQEVLRTAPNTVESVINMNELSQGAYFVQVTIDNVTETVRILKQ
ncbi:T9SS type A sorting domain-containing protein [uncultured Psychroserpens sp.]|uniref:T9SS type A sorting domain-containing protein n=1 Tax=uncultured Psychroserpens sp. TaxID=255436 RepID=UPI002609C105|nr:T9SS type A sorting domain-containing protein [uncultured Psychroserpens sp.]